MPIRVVIVGPEKIVHEINVSEIRVSELLTKLGLLSSEYVVLRNNMVVSEDDVIHDGDEVVVYPVKSGG